MALGLRRLGALRGRDLAESLVEPLAELVRVVVLVCPALARDHDSGRGNAGDPCYPEELPRHPHGCVGYGA